MWRTFDVDAVVESLPFDGAIVAAGRDGLGRLVSRARLAATVDHLRQVDAQEVVVTTASTLLAAAAGDPQQLVARLDAAQIAGIGVRLDTAAGLPLELLVAADRLALPIITFPEGAALTDVTAAVLDALLEAQRRRLRHILDIHQQFTQLVVAGGGAGEIAATLHGVLGCPVAVLDADGGVTVVVPSDADVDLAHAATVRRPIRAGAQGYGEIVAVTDERSLAPDGAIAIERAALGVAVRLAQANSVAEAQEHFAAITLEELIAGRPGDVADVTERAMSFGWDLSRPRAVLLASIDPPEDGGIPPGALNTIAAAARATLGPDAIVWTRSSTIAVLLTPDSDHPAQRRALADALRRELDARLHSVAVSIGVGRRVDEPADLSRSFLEASRAVDVGRWAKGRHVTELYDELGLERLLAATATDDLAEFVERAIGPLIEHDRVNHMDLVETLTVWLATRNMAEAARQMYVHYNTLKNRLERVEEIIGPVVGNSAHALECEVAIYIQRHYHVA